MVLEDTNGDGKYDKRTVFLDNLGFPTGVLPWRKGVLVTCAPDILYAEDVDGDGKADRRVTLYTGFKEGNQQHRVNSLVWGLDNWIHVANGDSGGAIRSLKTGKTLTFSGRDLRIRPDTGKLDAQTGQTQYGRSRDDHGNWFGGNNSVPMWHFVLADHYVRRNPHYARRRSASRCRRFPARPRCSRAAGCCRASTTPAPPAGLPRRAARSSTATTCSGRRSPAACSWRAGPQPRTPRGDLGRRGDVHQPARSTSPPASSSPRPTTGSGRRRCRPARTAPSGWPTCTAVIEHPEGFRWRHRSGSTSAPGHDLGRIYRVFLVGRRRALPRLDRLDPRRPGHRARQPVRLAALPTPHMMLLWKKTQRRSRMSKNSCGSPRALTRLQGAVRARRAGGADAGAADGGVADIDAGVRKQAVRLCEGRRLPGDDRLAAVRAGDDESALVRLQLACSLGEWADAAPGARLLRRDLSDRFLHAAAMTSLTPANLPDVVAGAMEGASPSAALIEPLMRQAAAMNVPAAVATLLDRAADQPQVLAAFLDGLAARGSSLATLGKSADPKLSASLRRVEATIAKARARADGRRPARRLSHCRYRVTR
ncbi:MAG: PVC-type heme-binding CxxCH protein [Gemmataceae bacterium]